MKRFLAFLLAALLLLTLLPSFPATSAAEQLLDGICYYSVKDGEATFLDVSEDFTGTFLELPDTLGGYPLTAVGSYACRNMDRIGLTVVIPASVRTVGDEAFYHFDTVYLLGKEVDLAPNSFMFSCVYIYEAVARANEVSCKRGYYLDEYPCAPIYLNEVTEGIFTYAVHDGETILLRAEGTGTVVVPNTLGGAPVVWIGPDCFCGKNTNYVLPDSVACIGETAFQSTEGTTLSRLPSGLKRLCAGALWAVRLEDPTLPSGLEYIGSYAFQYFCCERLVVPGSVERICYGAFECADIREIIIEEGVKYIEPYCFYGVKYCSITIPRSVVEADSIIFILESDGLGVGVMVYGYADSAAFDWCDKAGIPFTDLETGTVYLAPYEKTLDGVRYKVSGGRHVEVLGLTDACPDELIIPETVDDTPVTLIDMWAISSKTLRSVVMPDTVKTIRWHAFEQCPNLQYVKMSEGLEQLDVETFAFCPNLRVLYLPASIKEVVNGMRSEFISVNSGDILLAVREGSFMEDRIGGSNNVLTLKKDRDYVITETGVYEIREGEAILCGLVDEGNFYVVPDTVGEYPVTRIYADPVFVGKADQLVLGANVTTIEPTALLGTGIQALYTTPAVTSLPKPLFNKPGVIYGYANTYAEQYAAGTEHRFYDMEDVPFADVQKTDWFFSAVYFCFWNRVMSGQSDEVFNPQGVTSRAMLVSILYRLAGSDSRFGYESMYFTDVADYQWYTQAVNWAAGCGVVYGVSETRFAPNDPVTREQVASILFRFASLAGCDVSGFAPLGDFKDANKVSDWAKTSVMWAVDAGIISGTDEGKLNPQGRASRAEIASMIMRFTAWIES